MQSRIMHVVKRSRVKALAGEILERRRRCEGSNRVLCQGYARKLTVWGCAGVCCSTPRPAGPAADEGDGLQWQGLDLEENCPFVGMHAGTFISPQRVGTAGSPLEEVDELESLVQDSFSDLDSDPYDLPVHTPSPPRLRTFALKLSAWVFALHWTHPCALQGLELGQAFLPRSCDYEDYSRAA